MTKNLVTISLMIFIIVVVGILGIAVLTKQNNTIAPLDNIQNNTPSVVSPAPNNTSSPTINTITGSQVAQHNTRNNCWMIINNKVYNFTNYMNAHPGGASTIIPLCGKDGTTAFDTKGGQGSHSRTANNLLSNYYVGDLSK